MPERYTIYGGVGQEWLRAVDCVAQAYAEARLAETPVASRRFAEAVLARLGHLDPPMLVVALDEVDEDLHAQVRSEEGDQRYFRTVAEAFEYAAAHDDVWKISWPEGDGSSRVRMVRSEPGGNQWEYRPIMTEILMEGDA